MNKKDLLHHCRYYKGNGDIQTIDPDKNIFCKIESYWVNLTVNQDDSQSDLLSDALNDYITAGLKDFEKFDDTPLTLKALLFNRFLKYNERLDIKAFKEWYRKYTNKSEV